jgi:uncharacterized protein (TIGR00369 family)
MHSDHRSRMSDSQHLEIVARLGETVAFARHIGLRIDEVAPGRAVFSIDVAEIHMNGAGAVHGGVHAALIDSAMAVALIAEGLRVTTTQITVHYLEPITSGRAICTGEVVHRGRRTAIAEARVRDERGRLLASGTGSSLILEP